MDRIERSDISMKGVYMRWRYLIGCLCFLIVFCLPIPSEGTDFNGDGTVDFADFLLFAQGFRTQDITYDLNGDGQVGFGDFLVFAQVYAQTGREVVVADMTALNTAIASAEPGDKIVMQNGIWRDADILFEAKGDAGRLITLTAETPGEVILTGSSQLRIAGQYLVVDGLWFKDGALASGHVIQFRRDSSLLSHHCRLTNTAVTNYNPSSDTVQYKWISLYGTNNRVDHCFVSGKNHDGATVVVWVDDEPNDHQIDYNYFAGRPVLGRNGGETIRVGTSSVSMNTSRTVVEHNLFERCDGEIEIISSKSGENVYRHNTFRASQGMLTLRHGNKNVVEGNFFLGEGLSNTGGVRVIGEDHLVINNYFERLQGTGGRSALVLVDGIPDSPLSGYFQVKRARIALNTFVDCRQTIEIGNGKGSSGRELPPEDVTFVDNLVRGTGERSIVNVVDEPVRMVWEGNIFGGGDMGIQMSGIREAVPQLTLQDGLYRPVSDDVSVDAAVGDHTGVTLDIDGQERGGKFDVGCDEIRDADIIYRPLTAEDVGPAWKK